MHRIAALRSFLFMLILGVSVGMLDGAGGDYKIYLEIYNSMPDSEGHFEWLYSQLMLVFNFFGASFIIFQFFIYTFSMVILSLSLPERYKSTLTFYVLLVLFSIIFSLGIPRQFLAMALLTPLMINVFEHTKISTKALLMGLLSIFIHKPAILVGVILFALHYSHLFFKVVFSTLALLLLLLIIDFDFVAFNYRLYISSDISSAGAFVRYAVFVMPIALVLYWSKNEEMRQKTKLFMYASFALLLLTVFGLVSSTFLDRLMLYFIPIYLIFYNKFIFLFTNIQRPLIDITISATTIFLFYLWLFFRDSAENWRNASNYIFGGMI